MSRASLAAVIVAGSLFACARNPSLPEDPSKVLEAAVAATERTAALRFTIDGQGSVNIPGKPLEELLFGATGNLQFPARVHMQMNIDRPDQSGVRQELLYIDRILYVRPAGSAEQWQKTTQPVQIPGFDPLSAFDLRTYNKTSTVKDGGDETFEGVEARRLRIVPTEQFRAQAQAQLPPDFKDTRLEITTDMWVDAQTKRIRRVVQRYDYVGRAKGFFQSDMRFSEFGLQVKIVAPSAEEVSDVPVQIPSAGPPGR